MVLDAVSNFVRGNTDAAVGTSDTTVSVADASIFPDPATDGEYNVVIWDVNNFPRPDQDVDVEIMRVTARDTTADELTVTRGQEMTSAATHPEGSAIHLSPTAKMFSDIESTFNDFWNAGTQELTADVNNQSVSTDDVSIGDHYDRRVAAYDSDGDTNSALSLDLTGLSNPRAYTIILEIQGEGSGGVDLLIQANNDNGQNYDYVSMSGSTLNEQTGDTAFKATFVGGRNYQYVFDLGNPRSGNPRATFSQRHQVNGLGRIAQGRYNVSDVVSSIQITTSGGTSPNAIGEAIAIEEEIA